MDTVMTEFMGKRGMYEKHQIIEEPCESKGTRMVLKPSMEGDFHT